MEHFGEQKVLPKVLINTASVKDKIATVCYLLSCCLASFLGLSTIQFPSTSPTEIFQANMTPLQMFSSSHCKKVLS